MGPVDRVCSAYDRIREKYNTVLFAQFGGCQEASSTMKHNSDNVRLFMDQEPSFQVAKFVYECMTPDVRTVCRCGQSFPISLAGRALVQALGDGH